MADPEFGHNNRNRAGPGPTATPLWALTGLSGRLNRAEYWWAQALLIAGALVLLYTFVGRSVSISPDGILIIDAALRPIVYLIVLLSSYMSLAVAVKRLHDLGLNGLLALATLIPVLNFIIFFALGLMPGERGDNKYGPAI